MRFQKLIFIILSAIIFCFAFIGCQETPSQQIVVNQQDTAYVVSNTFKEIELPAEVVLPASQMGKAHVRFQANVVPSQATGYPIIKVTPDIFRTKQIQDMLNTLLPEKAKLYKAWEKTKEDYIQLMAETYQLGIENEDIKRRYDWLSQASQQAPLTVRKEPFSFDEVTPDEHVRIFAEYGEGSVFGVSFMLNGTSFAFNRDTEYGYMPFSWIEEGEPYEKMEPQISQDAARETALQALRALGLDFPVAPVLVEPVVIQRLPKTEWSGWQFYFARTYSGIPTTFADHGSIDWRTPPSIGSPWPKEMIRIIIDQYGVFCFCWEFPIKSASVAAENIELLPLQDAVFRAQQLLLYLYAAAADDSGHIERLDITVEKIELMMGVLSVQNQSDIGQAVPLWKFYYTLDTGAPGDKDKMWYVCISGINGSYVEPNITTQAIEDAGQSQ